MCGYVKEADSSAAYLDIMFAAFTGEQPSWLSCSQIHDMFAQWIAAGDASGCWVRSAERITVGIAKLVRSRARQFMQT